MNLLELRQQFRATTGRYDLVNADGSDNGLNFHISAAQKYLDRKMDNNNSIGRVFKDISSGEWLVKFEDCRSVLEVWCIGPDGEGNKVRLPLTQSTLFDLRGIDEKTLTHAYTAMTSDVDSGRPQNYAVAQLRLQVDSDGTTGGIGSFMDVLADGHQTFNGVVFLPPADGDYVIEVVGNFYNMSLSADTDSSFWSGQHPDVLIMAIMRQLEIFNRNTAGVKDWEASIDTAVIGIDMDAAKEESSNVTQMEG